MDVKRDIVFPWIDNTPPVVGNLEIRSEGGSEAFAGLWGEVRDMGLASVGIYRRKIAEAAEARHPGNLLAGNASTNVRWSGAFHGPSTPTTPRGL